MKKLKRVAQRFKGLTVGLDLHKKWIQFCVLDVSGNEIENGRLNSNERELTGLVERLQKGAALQFSIEACACFIWVFDLLVQRCGRSSVHVAQPSRIKVIANSMEKNDANDAWWLAYLLFEGRLPEAFVAEGDLRELRIASRELRWYTEMRADLLRRLRSHCTQAGKGLPKAWQTSKIKRKQALGVVKSLCGQRRRALMRLMVQIRSISKEIIRWRRHVEEIGKRFKAVQLMIEELPGMGSITAGTIFAELGDPKRFRNQKAYAKATGLTPGYRESGGRSSPTAITRAGSSQARWALTRAILACFSCRNGPGRQIALWIQRRCARKKKKAVIVAAARKMAEGIWRLFSMGECFDLKRAYSA